MKALALALAVWAMVELPPDEIAAFLSTLPSYAALQAKVQCVRAQLGPTRCYVWYLTT